MEVLFLEIVGSPVSRCIEKRHSPPDFSSLTDFLRSKVYGRVSAGDMVVGPVAAAVCEMKKPVSLDCLKRTYESHFQWKCRAQKRRHLLFELPDVEKGVVRSSKSQSSP